MSPERRAAIERAVVGLLARLTPAGAAWPSLPIDVEQAAQLAGLRVERVEAGITGTIIENVDGVPVSGVLDFARGRVYIDASEVPARQRFTIAHELAHEVLGHEAALGGGVHAVASQAGAGGTDAPIEPGAPVELEAEADTFAGLLLVPPQLLQREITSLGGVSVPLLAARFGVSAAAMQHHVRPWLPEVVES